MITNYRKCSNFYYTRVLRVYAKEYLLFHSKNRRPFLLLGRSGEAHLKEIFKMNSTTWLLIRYRITINLFCMKSSKFCTINFLNMEHISIYNVSRSKEREGKKKKKKAKRIKHGWWFNFISDQRAYVSENVRISHSCVHNSERLNQIASPDALCAGSAITR